MDIATILGMSLALVLILLAIIFDFNNMVFQLGQLQFFINFPSVLIVVGGSWMLFLPLAYIFGSVLDGGVVGAWAGATLYIVAIAALMFLRLQRERWKEVSI